ncbi:hypothetical protein BCR33DRAFT_717600, partial [Rhizoclosmatium globosum]
MHTNAPPVEELWPAKWGHTPQYFEDLLSKAETESYQFGRELGLAFAGLTGLLTFAASKLPPESLASHGFSKQFLGYGFKGIRTYHVLLVATMTGLVSSQFATHYCYQLAHDRITEQRRREAFF